MARSRIMGTCIASALSTADPDLLSGLVLAPGTYYLMLDIYPSPSCFDFELYLETAPCPTATLSPTATPVPPVPATGPLGWVLMMLAGSWLLLRRRR